MLLALSTSTHLPHLTAGIAMPLLQIVWKATTAVGCGLARCGSATMAVCRYTPAGNLLGPQFVANV